MIEDPPNVDVFRPSAQTLRDALERKLYNKTEPEYVRKDPFYWNETVRRIALSPPALSATDAYRWNLQEFLLNKQWRKLEEEFHGRKQQIRKPMVSQCLAGRTSDGTWLWL